MTEYDLLMLIHNSYCNGNIKDTIIEANNLLFELTEHGKRFAQKLEDELEEFSISNGKCPLCSENLILNSESEDRGEFLGFSSKEEMYYLECEDEGCSYTSR